MKWFWENLNQHQVILSKCENRKRRCAFTGHRPEKVVGCEGRIIVALRKEILKSIDDGCNVFLTGMSRGVDYGK